MCAKKKHFQRGFGLIIVSLLVLGGVGQIFPFQENGVAATPSEEPSTVASEMPAAIEGNTWYIDDTVYMNGSEGQASFSGDYNVQINGTGKLVINDATFRLTLDRFHRWDITVKSGGELRLNNSKIATTLREGGQLRPYYNTTIDVRGSMTMHHGSSLEFPGWVYGRAASIDIINSSLRPLNVSGLGDGEDDCPRLITYDSEVNIIDSEIESYYRNGQLQVTDQNFVPENYDALQENDDDYHNVEGGSGLTIQDWVTLSGRDFHPNKRISALYLQARYFTFENYTNSMPLEYNTGSGWNTATLLDPSSDGTADGSIIWSLDVDNLTEINDLQVRFDNTNDPDQGGANFTQIRLVYDYENDLTFFNTDLTVINSRIDVDFNPADIDPRFDVQRSTNSTTWLMDSSYNHRAIRLLDNSQAKIYGINASTDVISNGDPIVAQDDSSTSYIYRWTQIKAMDKPGTPMSGANITVRADTEQENLNKKVNGLNAPVNNTVAWDYMRWAYEGHYQQSHEQYVTGPEGHVTFFLLSDIIEHPGDWPNANHVGNYLVNGTYQNSTHDVDKVWVEKQKSIAAFPDISWESNHPKRELKFNTTLSYWEFTPIDLSLHPDPVTRGRYLSINTTVENNGDLSAAGQDVKIAFYLDGSATPVTTATISTLTSANGYNPIETNRTEWMVDIPAGIHNLTAKVDPDNEFLERYEDNNTIYQTFEVKGKPDLQVDQVVINPDSNIITGTDVNVSASIRNSGPGLATDVTVRFTDETSGEVIGSTTVPRIPGQSTVVTDTLPWDYNLDEGEYTVKARVDSENTTDESEEGNNIAFATLEVGLPDMWIDSVYVSPIEGSVGSTFDVWANVRHTGVPGTDDVPVAFINNETGDEIGRVTVSLADDPQNFDTESIKWDGYSGVGTYNITAEIDPDGNVSETNEDNNMFDGFATLTIYPKPDLRIGSMSLAPSNEVDHGTTVTVTTVIENTGVTMVDNINVVFKLDDPETGQQIQSETISIDSESSQTLSFDWTAEVGTGQYTSDYEIYAIIDPADTIIEENEDNNQESETLTVNLRPDLAISGVALSSTEVTEGDEITISGTVRNNGETDANQVKVKYYAVKVGPDVLIGTDEIVGVPGKGQEATSMTWDAALSDSEKKVETRNIRVVVSEQVQPLNDTNLANNEAQTSLVIRAPPELSLSMSLMVDGEEINDTTIYEMDTLNVTVQMENSGGTAIENGMFMVSYKGGTITSIEGFELTPGKSKTFSKNWLVELTGSQTITAWVNSSAKNPKYSFSTAQDITISELDLQITGLDTPDEKPKPDTEITIGGRVVRESDSQGVGNIQVRVYLADDKGNRKTNLMTTSTNNNGDFSVAITTPKEGDYTIVVQPMDKEAQETGTLSVESAEEGGLIPWWIIAVIIAAAAIAVVVVAYFQLMGEEEMVECGNCGSTIPADSTSCPECGVDFDMSTVKCSECGEWIPADAENCPNCGAEFIATGKEVEDYRERMRKQYQKYVQNFMQEAKEDLGKRDLTKSQFMRWWKQQPSYLTFEEWLEREEKRRKEGSLECPECGALNSIDDAICQKCGSPLIELEGREQSRNSRGGEGQQQQRQPQQQQQGSGQQQQRQPQQQQESGSVKKVKKRPKEKKVKKKVVKKPKEE